MVSLYIGDARDVLASLPEKSVHAVITSPPYYGLRAYKSPPSVWGGKKDCKHKWGATIPHPMRKSGQHGPGSCVAVGTKAAQHGLRKTGDQGCFCGRCGAWRGVLGMEPTLELYVEHLGVIGEGIRRVLRDDGIFWLNLGDSYMGSGGPGGDFRDGKGGDIYCRPYNRKGDGLKMKDMCAVPWRVALAFQMSGWWLRSDCIWKKENVMPESIDGWRWEKHRVKVKNLRKASTEWATKSGNTSGDAGPGLSHNPWAEYKPCPGCAECLPNDGLVLRRGAWRPTKAHEYVFMFTKGERYFGDGDAVREEAVTSEWPGIGPKHISARSRLEEYVPMETRETRNRRTVWTINTTGFKGAHFATFPPALVEVMVNVSTSFRGVCRKCGSQWARVVNRKSLERHELDRTDPRFRPSRYKGKYGELKGETGNAMRYVEIEHLGWRPTCKCNAGEPIPAVVLDPFVGSGTACFEAQRLGRDAIGIDVSDEYIQMSLKRVRDDAPLFNQVEVIYANGRVKRCAGASR